MKYLFLFLISFPAFASLPEGKFEGRTSRSEACTVQFDGNEVVFGYEPHDRPWGTCRTTEMLDMSDFVRAQGPDCRAEFELNLAHDKIIRAIMTFNEPGSPFRTIRCFSFQ